MLKRSIAVAMVAAIAITPVLRSEHRPAEFRTDGVYWLLTWEEQSHVCIAAAPVMLDECGEELAWVHVETEEQLRLEDGTLVSETSSSYSALGEASSAQDQSVSEVALLIATTIAGAAGWQAGWMAGTAAAPAIQAVATAWGGSALWGLALGAVAPWLGGAVLAGGLVY